MWVARCGSEFEGGDSFEFFSEERNKLSPFFFWTQQIQRIDDLCPMSAALERSKMDDEK
tara:strand:+ start:712 stop:888 length:177 start_codon:yes stop_codon:yes gene_type:complete